MCDPAVPNRKIPAICRPRSESMGGLYWPSTTLGRHQWGSSAAVLAKDKCQPLKGSTNEPLAKSLGAGYLSQHQETQNQATSAKENRF